MKHTSTRWIVIGLSLIAFACLTISPTPGFTAPTAGGDPSGGTPAPTTPTTDNSAAQYAQGLLDGRKAAEAALQGQALGQAAATIPSPVESSNSSGGCS